MMDREELRLECLKLAHERIQPREAPADTTTKAETYFDFVTKPKEVPVVSVQLSTGPRGKKKKKKN